MKNSEYWKKRFTDLEKEGYQQGETYYKDLQEQFRITTNNIQMDIHYWYQRLADNNGISYAAAKRLLKKGELNEFQWTVNQYIKAGKENAIDRKWMKELENASARYHISHLEAMKIQIQQHAELLFTQYEGGSTEFLGKLYQRQYYHTAFEITKGIGVGHNLAAIDKKKINFILQRPWAQDGINFSSRIWTNKEKLITNLHTQLSQCIIRGDPPQKAISNLAKTMDVTKKQASRLIMTESAAISSRAQQDCLKQLKVDQYQILATLDNRTSDICQEMDGKVFDTKDYVVGLTAPPFHPSCRSTTIPYFDDEFSTELERAARDESGKTYYVPANMTYKDWEKQFVKNNN